jgi:cephalosporin-C deacetylase
MNINKKVKLLVFVILLNIVFMLPVKSESPVLMKRERSIKTLLAHETKAAAFVVLDSLSKPGIDEFWKMTLQRLASVPMNLKIDTLHNAVPFREFKITFSSLDGVQICALLSLPVQGEAPAKPWPVIITVPGYGGWQQGVMLSECQRGYAILQVFPRGQGESADLWKIKGTDKLTMNLNQPDGAYYQGAYADVIRGIDFVNSRKDLAANRISLVGTSQGGGIALAVAALDPRVKTVVAHLPLLCNFRLAAQIPKALVKNLLDKAKLNNESSLNTLDYFDPLQLISKFHGPALISAGGKDQICPIQTINSVYKQIPGKKKLKVYPELAHTSCLDFYNESWKWLNRYL